jgi:hypothetical protein
MREKPARPHLIRPNFHSPGLILPGNPQYFADVARLDESVVLNDQPFQR